MNEQASMMNQPMMNPPPPPALLSAISQQPPPQLMNQPQPQPPQVIMNNLLPNRCKQMSFFPPQLSYNSRTKRQKPHYFLNSSSGFCDSQMLMNPPQPQQQPQRMMNRGYGMWGHPLQPMDLQLKYQNPNPIKTQQGGVGGGFGKPPSKYQLGPRNNWKGKKVNKPDNRLDLGRRIENPMSMGDGVSGATGISGNSVGSVGGGFHPPSLKDLQYQNRVKTRRYFQKNYYNNKKSNNRGKFAPRNTSSFIIRAKKSGGIAELVSPCPVTPAVLPTPVFSPSREVLVDMAKEEWGVDGYGTMKGLIRLRNEGVEGHEEEEEDEGGSSESDVEEHVEVERRLDHDLSRFEMIYPNYGTVGGMEYNNVLENRVDDQDSHIAQLEEENLILKERLFLMERELGDLRRRLQSLERQSHDGSYVNEEVVENMSENESDSRGGTHSTEDNEEFGEENMEANLYSKVKQEKFLDANGDGLETGGKKAEIKGQKENRDEVKHNIVEPNEQKTNCGINNGEAPINTAVGGQEESKDEISVSDVEQNVQNNKSSNDDIEELDKTPVDVFMD